MAVKSWTNVILIIAAIAVALMLIWPFFTALAFAAVVAFMLSKPYKWLSKKIPEAPAAWLLTFAVLGIIVAFILVGVNTLLNEFGKMYLLLSNVKFEALIPQSPELANALQSLTRLVIQKSIESLTAFISEIPRVLLSLFIFTISVFFFLRDGEKLYNWLEKIFPLPPERKEHMFRDLKKYANSFITVWFMIGILQGLVAVIGFLLFGLPGAMLAGVAAAVLSILPVIGPYALYVPIAAILFFKGDTNIAVGIAVYGLSIGSFLDYVVRPYYAGKWSAIHPLVMLVGMLGGMLVIGPAGIIVGPAALVVIISILHGAGLEFGNHGQKEK
jgi:predicted PurR-regulated permease PerM